MVVRKDMSVDREAVGAEVTDVAEDSPRSLDMAPEEDSIPTTVDGAAAASPRFLCGVIEGFYGKPWTKDQRLDLFRRMKDLGLNAYVYAPKDDYKHRAFWRDPYSSNQLAELSSLIREAQANRVQFFYAISPGIDILFSSDRDVLALKKKLQQLQQCGCDGFAVLFDDIDPELSPVDQTAFPSFGHAQVAVTNEIHRHLGEPKFLFCPTEYCATRAVPNVATSKYLAVLGEKLHPAIDVLWTGPQVISREISEDSIKEVSRVLRRNPVIWDNYHANDYDQSRVFLGPLDGRPPELKPLLNGFLANPNCEFHGNWVAIFSLAAWFKCFKSLKVALADSTSAMIVEEASPSTVDESAKAETSTTTTNEMTTTKKKNGAEDDDDRASDVDATAGEAPSSVTEKNGAPLHPFDAITAATLLATEHHPPEVYMPERALFRALEAWLPLFRLKIDSDGRAVESETPIDDNEDDDVVDIDDKKMFRSTGSIPASDELPPEPLPRRDMTAAAAAAALNGALTAEPMDCASSPSSPRQPPAPSADSMQVDGLPAANANSTTHSGDSTVTNSSQASSDGNIWQKFMSNNSNEPTTTTTATETTLSVDDLLLFVDLYYAPFTYGPRGVFMLNEFKWLKANVSLVTREICSIGRCKIGKDHEVKTLSGDGNSCCQAARAARPWHTRAQDLIKCCHGVRRLYRHLSTCQNRPLLYELLPYLRNLLYMVNLLLSYVKWMGGTGGLEKKFMGSGVEEPWVFRGGLVAEFQRHLPSHSLLDFDPLTARPLRENEIPTLASFADNNFLTNVVRPFFPVDKLISYDICKRSMLIKELFGAPSIKLAEDHPDIWGDCLLGPFIEHVPDLTYVIEDDVGLYGFCCGVTDAKKFYDDCRVTWVPEMRIKYETPSISPTDVDDYSAAAYAKMASRLHALEDPFLPKPEILEEFPGFVRFEFLQRGADNLRGCRGLWRTARRALQARGCRGVFTLVPRCDSERRRLLGAGLAFRTLDENLVQNDVEFALMGQTLEE